MKFLVLTPLNILKRFLNASVLLTSIEIVVAFSSGTQFFHTAAQSCRAPQNSDSARVPKGAVQPPLHRTPRAVLILERFGSSKCYEKILSVWSGKIVFRCIFETLVAFSVRIYLILNLSQGAGELGPLGSAGRIGGLPTRQNKLIERN